MNQDQVGTFSFPRWMDRLRDVLGAILLGILPIYLVILVWYGASPRTTDVGYAPVQPIPYSHALHVGQLGLDCRYCHNTVETAAHAAIPPTLGRERGFLEDLFGNIGAVGAPGAGAPGGPGQ